MGKQPNIDWEEYWFSEYRKRTPDEIASLEIEIKKDLLKQAEEFLKRTPECKKTAQEIADEKWDNEFDRFEWQREMRSEEYHESNIDKLFTQVFYELLKNSELIIKSSDEKAEVKDRCYTQFFDRIKDQLKDKASGVPAIYIPLHDHEGMKRLVRTFLLDFEPRLAPNNSINELESEEEIIVNLRKRGLLNSQLLSLIKNRIGFRIDHDLKIKRSLVTVEEKIAFINRYAERILEGINNEIASGIINAESKKIEYKDPTEDELIRLVDEFLYGYDDRFSIPSKKQIGKTNKGNDSISKEMIIDIYIHEWIKSFPQGPKLVELSKKALSNASWSRRINNQEFNFKCGTRILELQKRKYYQKGELIDKLNGIKSELANKVEKLKAIELKKNKKISFLQFQDEIDPTNASAHDKRESSFSKYEDD